MRDTLLVLILLGLISAVIGMICFGITGQWLPGVISGLLTFGVLVDTAMRG